MKNLFYILIFVLPLVGFSQNDSVIITNKEQASFKHQIDLDVEFLAFSVSYKKRIAQNFSIGLSIGGGSALHLVYANTGFDESNFTREIVHIGIPLKYHLNDQIQFEFEPRFLVTFPNGFRSDYGVGVFGMGVGVYYGVVVQIGFRVMTGYFRYTNTSSSLYFSGSLLIIRVPIRW